MKLYKEFHRNISKKTCKLAKMVLGLFLVMVCTLSVFAASAVEENGEEFEKVVSSVEFDAGIQVDNLLQVLLALVAVILIIFVLSIALKKLSMLPGSSGRLIKVIAGISLSSKDRLLLIQVGDEQILISASPGNVRKVHELTHPVEVEVLASSESSEKSSFRDLFNSVTMRSRA